MPAPFPHGIFAPMCTPFIDGELDLLRARRHAAELVRRGAHGILVAGSGGEFIAMSLDERKRLAERSSTSLRAPRRSMSACHIRTTEAVELARHAESIGADAMLVIAPFFMRPHRDAVGATSPPFARPAIFLSCSTTPPRPAASTSRSMRRSLWSSKASSRRSSSLSRSHTTCATRR